MIAMPTRAVLLYWAMVTLFLVVFLDLVGFGMIIPVFPFYAEQVGVDPAAVIFFLGLYSFGQLVGAPVWGAAATTFMLDNEQYVVLPAGLKLVAFTLP